MPLCWCLHLDWLPDHQATDGPGSRNCCRSMQHYSLYRALYWDRTSPVCFTDDGAEEADSGDYRGPDCSANRWEHCLPEHHWAQS